MYQLALLLIVSMVSSQRVSYKNHKLYRLNIKTDEQLRFLKTFSNDTLVKIRPPLSSGRKIVYPVVHPKAQSKFQSQMDKIKMQYEILNDNIEEIFEKQRGMNGSFARAGMIQYDRYYTYDQIKELLEKIVKKHPNTTRLEQIGLTYEEREMFVLQIKMNSFGKRPIIFIDAGMYANEWLGPALALYVIDKVLGGRDLSPDVDWHILPVANPDGYAYTHEHDRLWFKTRSPQAEGCMGVAMRRNFGFKFAHVGESYPCDDDYWGPSAFSEPESDNIRKYITGYSSRIKLYLTVHGYGEFLLYPWAYTTKLPRDNDDLVEFTEHVIRAMFPEHIEHGNYFQFLDPVGGTGTDWAKAVRKIKYSYTLELYPDEGLPNGHHPAHEITEITSNIFPIFRGFAQQISWRYGYQPHLKLKKTVND